MRDTKLFLQLAHQGGFGCLTSFTLPREFPQPRHVFPEALGQQHATIGINQRGSPTSTSGWFFLAGGMVTSMQNMKERVWGLEIRF